ncbi:hypothetical protein LTR22_023286 [Elasticomyces elasticus]|nr:hypothetical protein LTR22_023286 [Elasticomyces elasticus]
MAEAQQREAVEEPLQMRQTAETEDLNEKLEEKNTDCEGAEAKSAAAPENGDNSQNLEKLGAHDKYEITEDDCYSELGYEFSNKKKWYILTIIFIVQVSMNFNTSLYGNAVKGISTEFSMFLTEPIVLVLSLLSGFSDALIFMFIQSFALIYKQWNFSAIAVGLAFVPIGIGYFIAWALFIPAIRRNIKERQINPDSEKAHYESRLWFLLYTAPCLPIGLIGFAWTIQGRPLHWIGSMIFAAIIGIANYAIYMATIDYMICAYGPYSASATGGNGTFSESLARRKSQAANKAARPADGEPMYSQQLRTFGESRVTPRGTPRGTPHASRANSLVLVPRKAQ